MNKKGKGTVDFESREKMRRKVEINVFSSHQNRHGFRGRNNFMRNRGKLAVWAIYYFRRACFTLLLILTQKLEIFIWM